MKSSSDGRYWLGLLGRPGFLFFPVFHDLDLPPFQNNLSSACSYFPEQPKKSKSIKIVSDQVILSSNNGKRWKAIEGNLLAWISGIPSTPFFLREGGRLYTGYNVGLTVINR